ncbi:MAG: hypothetical protein QM570_21700 [Planctomycetota bacterium]|nr:hypothetical protein [Planctomycetota bacterium]
MKPQSILASIPLWILLILFACATVPDVVLAQDPPKSCQETTERVLKPYLDHMAAAEDAAKQYEEQNAEQIKKIEEQIRLRQESRKVFDDTQAKENEDFGNRIKWANEAIAEAQADVQKRLNEMRKQAVEARAAGRDDHADAIEESARKLAAELGAGKISWYKRELGQRHTIAGWREYVAKQGQDRAERMAAYGGGEVSHYIRTLGTRATWNGIEDGIAKKREELATAQKREYGYYLQAIGAGKTGREIDEYVTLRRDELADARARIAAGTYSVYVPALGAGMDRNAVQKLVGEARETYRQTVRAWGAKTYQNYNPACGMGITNGRIEEIIAEKRQDLLDFQALGEDARVYCAGAGRTAREIRERIAIAQARNDNGAYNQAHEVLAAWRKAREGLMANKQKEIDRWEAILVKHKEIHTEDLAKQKANIDGRLQDALNQTPCGGAGGAVDANGAVIDRHHNRLDGLSESDQEKQDRRDRYDDRVYVEPDGTVHGDPRDAWINAMRDTGLSETQQQSVAERLTIIRGILKTKDFSDWLSGFKDAAEMAQATAAIEEFIQAMEGIDIQTMKNADFYARRREIRQLLPKVSEALESGMLSPGRIQRYIDALVKSGSGTRETRQQIRMLQRLLDSSQDMKNLWRSSAAWRNLARNFANEAADGYRKFVSGTSTQIAQRIDASWSKMSKMDRGLLVLSVAAASAEAYDRIQQGAAASDAIARSSVNFAIDLAIAGFPITAAAEMATQILFTSYGYATGDEAWAEGTLSNTSKWVAQQALDQVADGAAYLGEASVALERMVFNEPNIREILGNVDYGRLRQSLSRVEDQIAALPPGHADEARLLRMRETFRILIRAKQQEA